jgi:hypothetical protein
MTWIFAIGAYVGFSIVFYWWMFRHSGNSPESPVRQEWTLEHIEEEKRAA